MARKLEGKLMSDILNASQSSSGESDFEYQLATADGGDLYPIPSGNVLNEVERISGSLLDLRRGKGGQVFTFASTVQGEGSSFVSYSIARHISFMIDKKVAWVDANFRTPQNKLNSESANFREMLENPSSFDNLSINNNLTLIPNGSKHIRTTDLLESDNYSELLQKFQNTFEITIIDAPPVTESIDVGRIALPTLGLVLTVESRRLKHHIIKNGIEQLKNQGVNVIGSVVNKLTYDIPSAIYNRL